MIDDEACVSARSRVEANAFLCTSAIADDKFTHQIDAIDG